MTPLATALATMALAPGAPVERVADLCTAEALDRPLWPVASEEAAESAEVAASAALLASIAIHESGLDPRVGNCRILGPRNAASWWQLESLDGWTRAEVCASPEVAARVALGVLTMHRRRCATCVPAQIVNGYAGGDPGKGSRAAREIVNLWATLAKRVGVVVFPYSREVPRWL